MTATAVPNGFADQARAIVREHGWNATVYRALDADMEHWLSGAGDALVGYTRHAGTRVVAGAPVASQARLAQVAAEFEADAARHGEGVCYVCAEERLLTAVPGSYAAVKIGAQPIWSAQRWAEIFDSEPKLRAQRNRAVNKGVVVEPRDATLLVTHPGIAACRRAWLDSKRLPQLAFLAYTDLARAPRAALADRRLFTASRAGEVVAYLVASPIPGRNGWLFEQVVRAPAAVNGTVELLVDTAVRSLAAEGSALVTLGLAPLAGVEQHHAGRGTTAARTHLSRLLVSIRTNGAALYDFAGLEAFKRKFRPERWEDIYLLSREPRTSVRTLFAVGAAFCAGKPTRLLLSGLLGLEV